MRLVRGGVCIQRAFLKRINFEMTIWVIHRSYCNVSQIFNTRWIFLFADWILFNQSTEKWTLTAIYKTIKFNWITDWSHQWLSTGKTPPGEFHSCVNFSCACLFPPFHISKIVTFLWFWFLVLIFLLFIHRNCKLENKLARLRGKRKKNQSTTFNVFIRIALYILMGFFNCACHRRFLHLVDLSAVAKSNGNIHEHSSF